MVSVPLLVGWLACTTLASAGLNSEEVSPAQVIAYVTFEGPTRTPTVKVLETDDPELALSLFPKGTVGGAIYRNLINETGWAFLELATAPNATDEDQAAAAGMLEGYLTAEILRMHVNNVARPFCDGRQMLCDRIQNYLDANANYVKQMTDKYADNNAYWHQVRLYYLQQEHITRGYELARKENPQLTEITENDILWLNVQGDLEDLVTALSPEEAYLNMHPLERGRLTGAGSCSAFIKIIPEDIFMSHDTWSSYETMMRVQKKYTLSYRVAPGRQDMVPGRSMSFSSYPGVISSGDDFYVISSGMVTIETTIGNGNKDLWKFVKPIGQVAEATRVMVSNRLATNGRLWTQIFSKYNSGTYNNQWMIVDLKRFAAGQKPKSGLLWLLEQLPGHVKSADITDKLAHDTYFASYNVPYFDEIFNKSGASELRKKFGDWFSYENCPRAKIFRRDQGKVRNLESTWKLMRSNDFKNDPLSVCNCTPTHNAENAIAARSDLNPASGKYPWRALGHRNHGATDTKITSLSMASSLRFLGESGPPHYSDSCPPFSWSTADFAATTPHEGLPDFWNFPPVTHNWEWQHDTGFSPITN